MTNQQLDEERIFHIAREFHDEATRSEYLDQICAGDQALRERVEALLKVHERGAKFPEVRRTGCRTNGRPRPAAGTNRRVRSAATS